MRIEKMNIYIYSDESGVFDKIHNDYFIYGGLIILEAKSKNEWSRKYAAAEAAIRKNNAISLDYELKATNITNKDKSKLFRSLNNCYKFGAVIRQQNVLDRIFQSKKDKQRFLDYAYKIAVKKALIDLIRRNVIKSSEVERLYFYADEHTTATNGRYELREALEQEFKNGTYNYNYVVYYPPIFENLKNVQFKFCNSKTKLLIRAADIVSNKIYYHVTINDIKTLRGISNLYLTILP